jgi:hypothetical protein
MSKKTWKKIRDRITNIGKCRYCSKDMVNTDSFVAFLSTDKNGAKEKAHHDCMKKDDQVRAEEKTYE